MPPTCVICHQSLASQNAQPSRVCRSPRCLRTYQDHLDQGGRLCFVCGRPMARLGRPASAGAVCDRTDCRFRAGSLAGGVARACEICGIHLDARHGSDRICGDRYCRDRMPGVLAAENAQKRREREGRIADLAVNRWRSGAGSSAGSPPLPVVLPANLRPLEFAQERKQAFRQRLGAIAVRALHSQDQPAENTPTAVLDDEPVRSERFFELAGAGCATCRGYCCFNGREHAFLTAEVLRRLADAEHIQDAETLAERYLGYMPAETVQDSCVFHGPQGCGLPRSMRADICNAYLCPSLLQLDQHCDAQSGPQAYLLAATNLEDEIDQAPQVFSLQVVESL